jgi:hypothetical protein
MFWPCSEEILKRDMTRYPGGQVKYAPSRRKAFRPMRICQGRTRIPCAIPGDIAAMLNGFRLPRRRHLAQTHSYGVWTSSITATTGKLMSPGKVFGGFADRDGPPRMLFKGLILLSAVGVKIRERKHAAAARHAKRAAALLRQLMRVPDRAFERALGMSPAALAECAEAATRIPADLQATAPGQPQPVFNFILGANSRRSPSGSQKRSGRL